MRGKSKTIGSSREVCRKPRRLAPWFDGDCHAAKKTTRRLEQVYWRSRQPQCAVTVGNLAASSRRLPHSPMAEGTAVLEQSHFWRVLTIHGVCGIRRTFCFIRRTLIRTSPQTSLRRSSTSRWRPWIRDSTAGSEHPSVILFNWLPLHSQSHQLLASISVVLGRCPSKQCTWSCANLVAECLHSNLDQDCQRLSSVTSVSYCTQTCSCHSYTEETFHRSCTIKQLQTYI